MSFTYCFTIFEPSLCRMMHEFDTRRLCSHSFRMLHCAHLEYGFKMWMWEQAFVTLKLVWKWALCRPVSFLQKTERNATVTPGHVDTKANRLLYLEEQQAVQGGRLSCCLAQGRDAGPRKVHVWGGRPWETQSHWSETERQRGEKESEAQRLNYSLGPKIDIDRSWLGFMT